MEVEKESAPPQTVLQGAYANLSYLSWRSTAKTGMPSRYGICTLDCQPGTNQVNTAARHEVKKVSEPANEQLMFGKISAMHRTLQTTETVANPQMLRKGAVNMTGAAKKTCCDCEISLKLRSCE